MVKEKSLGLVLVQGPTLLTAQYQEIQDVKGRQAHFCDVLEVVSRFSYVVQCAKTESDAPSQHLCGHGPVKY